MNGQFFQQVGHTLALCVWFSLGGGNPLELGAGLSNGASNELAWCRPGEGSWGTEFSEGSIADRQVTHCS